jgi:hypothetical protein
MKSYAKDDPKFNYHPFARRRYALAASLCFFALIGVNTEAQTQWKHELLFSGARSVEVNSYPNHVNVQGVPIFTVGIPNATAAYRYKTDLGQLYLGPYADAMTGYINDSGMVAYNASDALSNRVMVDGVDYYTKVQPASRYVDRPWIAGVSNDGLPFWLFHSKATGSIVYRGYGATERELSGVRRDQSRRYEPKG